MEDERRKRLIDGAADLALKIVQAFEHRVTSTGARFFVVHLPRKDELDERFGLIPTATTLLDRARTSSLGALFSDGGHYSPLGNRIVAGVLRGKLAEGAFALSHEVRPDSGT